MEGGDNEQKNKGHKARVVGSKATKKEEFRKKKAGIELEPNRGNNQKAFQGPTAGSRKGQKLLRSLEKRETALHLPTMDKTLRHVIEEPPLLVVVVGPPGVGKSTLIRSMVKFYSNRNIQAVRGPITVVAGKSRRVTFLECPNTLTAMCDTAKVADLVLLMVDGSFGFEMETFEFLNIAQVHGFPRMFGVVSHLDQLKTGKALKKRKKFLRHRFWHEVAAGAKLLCLSPMVRGMYRSNDVLKLHRLLICVEPKIQSWRNTHSCILIDRHEDITAPQDIVEDEGCNRTIAFYGYARGKPLKPNQLVHIPGLGDYPIAHISHQEDPCAFDGNSSSNSKSQGHRMRHLSMKQKRLYAPYCDVSGVMYDDDAIYIQEDAEKGMIERSGEGLQFLRELQRVKPIDASTAALEVVRRPVIFRNEDTMELEMNEVEGPSSDDDDDDNNSNSSDNSSINNNNHLISKKSNGEVYQKDLSLYGLNNDNNSEEGDEEYDEDADLDAINSDSLAPRKRNAPDAIRENIVKHDWSDSDLLRRLKNLFVTGDWNAAGKSTGNNNDDDDDDENGKNSESEGSKGYESEDEEFEAITRGEKPLMSSSMVKDEDDENENDDEDDMNSENNNNNINTGLRQGKRTQDALAGVAHNSSSSYSWGAYQPNNNYHDNNKRRNGKGNVAEDEDSDYDILAEDDTNRDNETGALSDTELDGLVSTFLAPRKTLNSTGTKSGIIPSSLQGEGLDENNGAIQFYDPNNRHFGNDNNNGDNNSDNENNNEDGDANAAAAIADGKPLTEEQERLLQKKMAKKKAFDESYDMGGRNNTYTHYHHLTREVEIKKERLDSALKDAGDDVRNKIQLVGYFSGLYIRFVLENIPVEFVRLFNPTIPLIAGGVNAGEDQFHVVHARIKRHRWHPKILKAQDPLLLSLGWRRFQTQPIFATEDPNGRVRYLKYTPQHMHCIAAFYAPVAPPNTGFVAIPVRDQKSPNFRIPCTGYTLGNDQATGIVKKLKLIGTPHKVIKTTAFIKGMFNSDVEATKFVGAKLKSVSGIRGIVKAVLKGKDGLIRATFEDKIFPSDIVFCRSWKSVQPPKYCSIQRNLVDAEWVGMRSMRELRWAHNVPIPTRSDSEYHEIKYRRRADEEEDTHTNNNNNNNNKVLLSRNQRLQLPFSLKEEYIPLAPSAGLQQRLAGATTTAPEPREMRRAALLDAFGARAGAAQAKKEEAKRRAKRRHAREAAAEAEEYERQLKKAKKETARLREFRSQHKVRK